MTKTWCFTFLTTRVYVSVCGQIYVEILIGNGPFHWQSIPNEIYDVTGQRLQIGSWSDVAI